MITDDWQLLQQYARERSESAFGELVTRHIDLVYSAALRVAGGDRPMAEDVTQAVFIDLARKASKLSRVVVFAGWLHRHTSYVAAKAVRTERRRRVREQTAMEMRALDDDAELPWERIAPRLEECLDQLSASDRDAIVLRFLKRQDLRAVGTALGVSEDAAQKRVSRALEKLRGVLSRRGVALTATALASVLTSEAVTAAPAGLALGVTTASLAATAGTGSALTFLQLMASTKLTGGIAGAIVVISIVTPFAVQHWAQGRLRSLDEAFTQQSSDLAQLTADNQRLALWLAQTNSRTLPDKEWSELLRLRGEVGRLRGDLQALTKPKATAALPRNEMLAALAQRYANRTSQLKQFLDAHPAEKIPELLFLSDTNWLWLAGLEMPETEDGYRHVMSRARQTAEQNLAHDVLRPAVQQYAQKNNGRFPTHVSQLTAYFPTTVDDAVLNRWYILHASRLIHLSANLKKEDWVITQKSPVNPALDQRLVLSLSDTHSFADAPLEHWETSP